MEEVTAATSIDTKMCEGCRRRFERRGDVSNKAWAARRFCSIACFNSAKPSKQSASRVQGDTRWQLSAACLDADDPTEFDVLELHTPETLLEAERTAHKWCLGCPVLAQCGGFADANRHQGVWGGSRRRIQQGRYVREALIEGAPMGELPNRQSGVRIGWTK